MSRLSSAAGPLGEDPILMPGIGVGGMSLALDQSAFLSHVYASRDSCCIVQGQCPCQGA